MRCRECGAEIKDGIMICPECGAPVRMRRPNTETGENRPIRQSGSSQVRRSSHNDKKRLIFTAWAVCIAMLAAIVFIFGGLSINIPAMGSISIPVIFASSVLGGFSKLLGDVMPQSIFVGIGVYMFFAYVTLILFLLSVFMLVTRKKSGVLAGLIASGLMLILSIVVIIAAFVLNGRAGSMLGGTISPSVWQWLTLPVSVLNGYFLLTKGKIITR